MVQNTSIIHVYWYQRKFTRAAETSLNMTNLRYLRIESFRLQIPEETGKKKGQKRSLKHHIFCVSYTICHVM